jgi:dCMP deaminase
MQVAELFAEHSTCSRAKVGAVLVYERRIIATGYNGAPSGLSHCAQEHEADECRAVHAEANAIAFSARHGVRTEASVMYTTVAPCKTCAQLIINAGITKVYYRENYRNTDGIELLYEAGTPVSWLNELGL